MRKVVSPTDEAPPPVGPMSDDCGAGDPGQAHSRRANAEPVERDFDPVEIGAVFLARNRQQRRVWTVREGRVHFFVRPSGGGAFWSPGHPPHLAPTVELFLSEVSGRLSAGAGRDGAPAGPWRTSDHMTARPAPPHKNPYR